MNVGAEAEQVISQQGFSRKEGNGGKPKLKVQGAAKRFDAPLAGEHLALSDVSLELQSEEFVSIVGPSGCGKTTLLKACAGLVTLTAGSIEYHGTDGPVAAGEYGMVFQAPTLLPWWNITENVLLPARVLKMNRKRAHARASELLDLVGLSVSDTHKYPSQLSGGMQQRASLARALLHEPELLFMDEPFGALDAITREQMNQLLLTLRRQLRQTVMFVTHSIPEAIYLSDRVLVMTGSPGTIRAEVSIELGDDRPLEIMASRDFRDLELVLRAHMDDSNEDSPNPKAKRK